jgi:Ca2+/Na+ antiporter
LYSDLLFGLGLSFVVVCIKQYPQNYPVEATPLFYLTGTSRKPYYFTYLSANIVIALFLIGSLAASIVVISVSKFFISKKWGFVLLGVYVVYSVFLILGELHILF